MKTITFEDQGQDFLEWDIDDKGVVVGCRPFQGSIWCGLRVLNHRTLKVDGKARIRLALSGTATAINYPLVAVSTTK